MSVGAFAVLGVVGPDADDIQSLRGLSKRSPFLAASMTLFFLALAGLPPSLAGLLGKAFLFSSVLSAKFWGLAIIAALNSALACAYYFRVPAAMFFQSGDRDQKVVVPSSAALAIAVCAGAVVFLGVFPESVMNAAQDAATQLVERVQ
jgi:NADH-quinone oxidoreductase subunit N